MRTTHHTREPRVRTLFAADAHVGDNRWPVRVRDISSRGAAIETEVALTSGTALLLSRDHLRATGEVVWRKGNRYGLRFLNPIEISLWVHASAIESSLPDQIPDAQQDIDNNRILERISEEVALTARTVTFIGDILVNEPVMRVRHASAMQQLSIACQSLTELANLLKMEFNSESVRSTTTGSLRSRLLR